MGGAMAAVESAVNGVGRPALAVLREAVRAATLRPENAARAQIVADLARVMPALSAASAQAAGWVEAARADERARPLVEQMLEQFPLDSAQGKALMGLAESLLRTPDPKRADQLIAERLATIRQSVLPEELTVLLGSVGCLLPSVTAELSGEFSAANLTAPLVAPVVRAARRQSMQVMAHAFIVGETIGTALARG